MNKKDEKQINIVDLFNPNEITETTSGYKLECPDCGLQGGRTEGLILNPESNTAYCHSSGKWFKMLEAYALRKKIIKCMDGRDSGDSSSKILGGELFTLTLDEFQNEYGTETYNRLLEQLNIRKSIQLPGDNHYDSCFCDELGDVYKSRNILFFRGESKTIVEIGRYKRIDNNKKEYVETGFVQVSSSRLITLIERFVKPYTFKYTKTGDMVSVQRSMNVGTASIVLSSSNFQNKLPIIARIFDVQIPIIYDSVLTFPKRGYDDRFGSWLPFNAPQIKEDMFDLEEAKKLINHIFEEFCFESDKDRTHAIAGFITPFLRGLFPKFSTRTPIFIYMANRERAGKDYCAGCNGILYEGSKTEEPSISNDEKGSSNEELRKKIMACMMQGKKRFHSSNNKGLLNNSVFEGITTAEKWNDRILGRSENVTYDNEIDFSLSGNLGIKLTPDLSNRSRIINLHLIDEDANSREFKNKDLHGFILKNRAVIISALFALVKNWHSKGCPKGSVPFTSFPIWAEICGGVMEAAGYDNPCNNDKTAMVTLDYETEEMKQLFEACFSKFPGQWVDKQQIKDCIESENIMNYFDFNNKSDQTKFGIKFDKYSNRILSGILMKVDSMTQRSTRRKYMFENINQKQEVSTEIINNEIEFSIIDKKWQPCQPVVTSTTDRYFEHGKNIKRVEMLPNVANVANQRNLFKDCNSLEDYGNVFNNELNKQSEEKIKKILKKQKDKTDRELQFWEDPICFDIKVECTKDQVFDWIKNNPGVGLEAMDVVLGNGCLKFAAELVKEGKVKGDETGWNNVHSQ